MTFVHTTLVALLAAVSLAQEPRPVTDDERAHSVVEGSLRATMLWCSERGLDLRSVQLMEVLRAVDAAGAPRAATGRGDGDRAGRILEGFGARARGADESDV